MPLFSPSFKAELFSMTPDARQDFLADLAYDVERDGQMEEEMMRED
jgi:hypothetical protein